MKKILIITGGSKGLGKAIVQTYLEHDYQVISYARTRSEIRHENLSQIYLDFSKPLSIRYLLEPLFQQLSSEEVATLTLIHNAGTLGEVKPLEKCSPDTILTTQAINLTSPLFINALFLKYMSTHPCKMNIYHISTGAATKPYHGWSLYCTTKAGLEMMVKVLALENQAKKNIKIISINPGVIDTDMQKQIRQASESDFPNLERFIQLKETNNLANPISLAKKIYELERKDSFQSGETINLQ